MAWRLLPLYIAAIAIVAIGSFGAALALFEWNGRPFILGLEYGFYYLINTKLYIWSHERKKQKAKEALRENKKVAEVYVPRLSESKLHDLAWSLDIKEKVGQIGMRDMSSPGTQLQPRGAESALEAVRTAKEALVR